jgi:hypothetical protein
MSVRTQPRLGCSVWAMFLLPFFFVQMFFIAMNDSTLPHDVVFTLLLGWIMHLGVLLKSLQYHGASIAVSALVAACGLGSIHWLARRMASSRRVIWRWRSTICLTTILLLPLGMVFGTGGIVQQCRWLAKGPWLEKARHYHDTKTLMNARELVMALQVYSAKDEQARFPDHLQELVTSGCIEQGKLDEFGWTTLRDGDPPVPWIYVPGLTGFMAAALPVLILPLTEHNDSRIIATNVGVVNSMTPSEIRKLLPKWKEDYAALGISLPTVLEEYEQSLPAK